MWVWGPAGEALASAACGQTRLPSPLGRTHTSTQTHSARSLALSPARLPPARGFQGDLGLVSKALQEAVRAPDCPGPGTCSTGLLPGSFSFCTCCEK